MSESPHSRYFLLVSGLAAMLASLCCLGPLLLLTLGFSGAWLANLTVLESYRPVFIGLSLLALFLAGRRLFRATPSCPPGEPCIQLRLHHWQVVIFFGAAMPILLALIFPYLLPWFY